MIKEIIRDPIRLAVPSADASSNDAPTADDLADTLKANADRCVGMAANMIGVNVRIIVFNDDGKYTEMFNPEIVSRDKPYRFKKKNFA